MTRPRRPAGGMEPPPHLGLYVEVARLDAKLHRRILWRRLCRSCRDPWPCMRALEVRAQLGQRTQPTSAWWLAVPALVGLVLVAAAMSGLVR